MSKRSYDCCRAIDEMDNKRKKRELVAHLNPLFFDEQAKNKGWKGLHRRFQQFPTLFFANIHQKKLVCDGNGRIIQCGFPGWGVVDKMNFAVYPTDWTDGRMGPWYPLAGCLTAAQRTTDFEYDIANRYNQFSDEFGEQLVAGDWSACRVLGHHVRWRTNLAARYNLTGTVKMCAIPPILCMLDFNMPTHWEDFDDFPYPVEWDIVEQGGTFSMVWKTHSKVGAKKYGRFVQDITPVLTYDAPKYFLSGNFGTYTADQVIENSPSGWQLGQDQVGEIMYDYKDFHSTTGQDLVDGRHMFLAAKAIDSLVSTDSIKYVQQGVKAFWNYTFLDASRPSGMAANYESTGGNMFALRNRHLCGGMFMWSEWKINDAVAPADTEILTQDQVTLYEMVKSDATGPLKAAWLNFKADIHHAVALSAQVMGMNYHQAATILTGNLAGAWRAPNTTALTLHTGSGGNAGDARAWFQSAQQYLNAGYQAAQGLVTGQAVLKGFGAVYNGVSDLIATEAPMLLGPAFRAASGALMTGIGAIESAAPVAAEVAAGTALVAL